MFDIIGKRNWFFLFSGLVLVPGLIFILLTPLTNGQMGIKFSIDYTGGTVWQFEFKDPSASIDEVKLILAQQGLSDTEVSKDTANQFTIRTKRADLLPPPTPIPAATAGPSASAGASSSASSGPAARASAAPSASASCGMASSSWRLPTMRRRPSIVSPSGS